MKLFLLYGKNGTGKTTASRIIQNKYPNIKIFSFSDKLKKICTEIFPEYDFWNDKTKVVNNSEYTIRKILIEFAKLIKSIDIDYFSKELLKYKNENFLIADGLRFKHEYDFIKQYIPEDNIFILKLVTEKEDDANIDNIDDFPYNALIYNYKNSEYNNEVLAVFEHFIS